MSCLVHLYVHMHTMGDMRLQHMFIIFMEIKIETRHEYLTILKAN